ncbi:CoA transferase [Spirosoma luteolum]
MRQPSTGPLLGLRILDLTRLLPGPLGTMLMADMGADVIRIERPAAPDYVRTFPPYRQGESVHYLAYNRSKRSIWLDYHTDDGRAQFLELVRTADLVIEQFRPGYLDQFGVGYAAARAVNSRIIYVSITGYGQTGPYAQLAGHDINYTALAGVLGVSAPNPSAPPVVPGVQLADVAGGSYMGVIATLAALYARERTGEGQHVDVSMTDAVMPLLATAFASYAGTGTAPPAGAMPLSGGLPNYGVYRCRDGRYVALGTLEPKFWLKFCQLVGRPDWQYWLMPATDAELADQKAQLQDLFITRDQTDWAAFGQLHDVLITAVLTVDQLASDPHLAARSMVYTEAHPIAGSYPAIGVPLKFSATPAQPAWPAPQPGEDTDDVLAPPAPAD